MDTLSEISDPSEEKDEYEDLCAVCFDNKADVGNSCDTCKVRLCVDCWFQKCKLFCPICQRQQLNVPRPCHVCFKYKFTHEIKVCCVCGKWVCNSCDADYHACEHVLSRCNDASLPLLKDALCVFLMFHHYRLKCYDFFVMGRFVCDAGSVLMIKDTNRDKSEVIHAVWDVDIEKKKLFKAVARRTKMRKYFIGNLARGVKTYSPWGHNSYDHVASFLKKMSAIRICEACRCDAVVEGTTHCGPCRTKKTYLQRWMRACDTNKRS